MLLDAPRWQQRLFLAAYFGAELSTPRALAEHGANFTMPTLSLNKREGFVASGQRFLEQIAAMLAGFGVETKPIAQRAEQVNTDGVRSQRLRLVISSQPDNLINLWSRVGFEYNQKRQQARPAGGGIPQAQTGRGGPARPSRRAGCRHAGGGSGAAAHLR